VWNTIKGADSFDPKWQSVFLTYKVKHVYRESAGKFGSKEKSNVVVEYEHFLPYLLESLHPNVSSLVSSRLGAADAYHYASQVIFNFPPNRHNVYAEQVDFSFTDTLSLRLSSSLFVSPLL
jgi:hypothetical protein